ncbi:aminoglycoside phosphotransferase family protein [Actinomadura scrupuli]|uniref:phosphotransferase family protein n=1 Tax=Actinomadura scrupuli TaxID=559629 RepID=UPI003D96F351
MTGPPPVVGGAAQLTAPWLTAALAGRLDGATVTEVGAAPVGTGQVADSLRLTLTYDRPVDLPATLVAKVPAAAEASRAAARAVRTYEIEASFYAEIAPGLRARVPECFHCAYDPEHDDFVVLLEDLAPAVQADQITGMTVPDAAAALAELALLHAARWGDPALAESPWLNRNTPEATAFTAEMVTGLYPGFRERYAGRLEPDSLALIERFLPHLAGYLGARYETWTIVHGDFRADNLLVGAPRVAVLDWQTCAYGPAAADVSYFLGSSLSVTDRRAHEEDLVRGYHRALTAHGVGLDWDECWTGYRRYAFNGLVMAVGAAMLVERTVRGDEMFCTMADRHARHALDLDSAALLP